jgi:hypothetical protein
MCGYGLDDRAIEFRSPVEAKGFFPLALGPTQPPAQWVLGFFPGNKTRTGRDADHSPHLLSKSRMSRNYISSPPSVFMAYSGTALAFTLLIAATQTCLWKFNVRTRRCFVHVDTIVNFLLNSLQHLALSSCISPLNAILQVVNVLRQWW